MNQNQSSIVINKMLQETTSTIRNSSKRNPQIESNENEFESQNPINYPPPRTPLNSIPGMFRGSVLLLLQLRFVFVRLGFWCCVQVLIRIRPLSNTEKFSQGHGRCLRQESAHTLVWLGHPETRFTFDHIGCETLSQVCTSNLIVLSVNSLWTEIVSILG